MDPRQTHRINTPHLSREAQDFIKVHVERHVAKYGMPQSQAIAAAYAEAREKGLLERK